MSAPQATRVTSRISVRHRGSVQVLSLEKTPFTIGRLSDNDLSIDDPDLSRRHAEITTRDGHFFITDRQSTHGTFVNGTKTTEQLLKVGDRITFGQAELEITFEPSAVPQALDSGMSLFGFGRPQQSGGNSPLVELEGLSLFLDAARKLNATRVVDDVLITLLDTTLSLTKAARGFVYRVDEAGRRHLVTGRDTRGRVLSDDSGISHSILEDAAKSSSRFLITDTSRMADLSNRGSIVAHDLRSVICIPLFRGSWAAKGEEPAEESRKEVQGLLYLDSNYVTGELNKTSEGVLTAIAREASALLENARLVEAEQIAQVHSRELQIASDIQQQLMAVDVPDMNFVSVEARSMACKNVGGDFYDVVQTSAGLALVLVDVSGKGVSSALLASTLQGVICSQLESGLPLTQIAGWVDRFIAKKGVSGKYATMVLARIDSAGTLEYLNCGHVPGAWLSRGSVRLLNSQNLPVGLVPGGAYQSEILKMGSGDTLVLVSDGVTEASNPADAEFGLEGFTSALQQSPTLDGLLRHVTEFAQGRPFDDDCTALFARFIG